jgi:hypothetical protein
MSLILLRGGRPWNLESMWFSGFRLVSFDLVELESESEICFQGIGKSLVGNQKSGF